MCIMQKKFKNFLHFMKLRKCFRHAFKKTVVRINERKDQISCQIVSLVTRSSSKVVEKDFLLEIAHIFVTDQYLFFQVAIL